MSDPRYAELRRALEGDYRITHIVSERDDGAEYQAQDSSLERDVLIRAVAPELAGRAHADAFRREARTLAGLAHPSIPAVHHAGLVAGRFLHVVVEQPAGERLENLLRQGPLPAEQVRRLALDLLGALACAHAAGVAHGRVAAGTVIAGPGRYVLEGLEHGTPADAEAIRDDLRAVSTLLQQAAGEGRRGILSRGRRLPREVRRALRRHEIRPWTSAAEFREAIGRVDLRPWRRRWAAGLAVAAIALAAAVAAVFRSRGPVPDAVEGARVTRELALLPFEVDGAAPGDPLGSSFAHLVQLNLDGFPGLHVSSRHEVDIWLKQAGGVKTGFDWRAVARRLRVHWVAHGFIKRGADGALQVWLTLYDSAGSKTVVPEVRGPADDLTALGDSVTLQLVREIAPRADSLYEPVKGLDRVRPQALRAFLKGEDAFAQDAWSRAQRFYEVARDLDTNFALAEWRLANVKRWRRLPYEGDLREVYRKFATRFRPRDSMLIAALLEPDLATRLARLEGAVALAPADGYVRLLQAEELFHRGPLVGRGVGEAVPVFEAALTRDPFLALAYDHLVLAAVRFGRREAAGRALRDRRVVGSPPHPDDLDLVPFLELVHDERFVPWRAWLRYQVIRWRASPRQLAELEKVARTGTPWLDMPLTQLRYCRLLLHAGHPTEETYATAHEGMGLALFALGRPTGALAELDSAAAILDAPEARLQQAEWRVVPGALGLPGPPADQAREQLELLASDSALGPRASWALALAAQTARDTTTARRWMRRVPSGTPLRTLLEAREDALRGDFGLALARSDSVRMVFQVTRPPDAFGVAAFHLLRGEWLAAMGQRARADREWLWYEASDVEGWPQGLAQAGEVDAALGVYARLLRARNLLAGAPGDPRGCAHVTRVLELWSRVEPPLHGLVREAAALAAGCRS